MSTLQSIFRTLPSAVRGKSLADKAKIFLVIAFETTSFANKERRARVKKLLGNMAQDGLITIRFVRDGCHFIFKLRAGEDGDLSVASEFIREGYTFPDERPAQIIDGGANIGLFAVLASKAFPGVRIDCFEANPANIEALSRNLAINGANSEVINKALWSGDGELVFHSHMAYSGHVAEAGAETAIAGGVRVPAILPEIGPDCWMKVDIEGAEYEVLPALIAAGMYPRWISAELHYYDTKGTALLDLLEAHGYALGGPRPDTDAQETTIFATRAWTGRSHED